jgi:hypothetical protein
VVPIPGPPEGWALIDGWSRSRCRRSPRTFSSAPSILLAERLAIREILSLDSVFNVYRRFRRDPCLPVNLQE